MRRTKFDFPVTTLAGSTLKNFFALHRSHAVEPRYRTKFYLTAAVAAIFEIFNFIERITWQGRIRNHKLKTPPIFIIGFWRSGTTLLHNLMCQDPEASYTTTFQAVFPNLMLTQSWWLKSLLNYFIPEARPFDNVRMDVDFPQEEEFGMMNVQPYTIYKFFIYPADFDRIIEEELFTGNLPPEKIAQWKEQYAAMIAKAEFNTGGSRYIGKNPCNLARIGLLKSMYPDAKFIFIHRNPYQVTESLYKFILSIFEGVQLQDTPATYTRETVVRLYEKIMLNYFRDREALPASELIEIRMDEFVKDKQGHLRKIYETFGLGDFERVLPHIEKFLVENPYAKDEPVQPEPETIALVNRYAAYVVKKLGYAQTESWK